MCLTYGFNSFHEMGHLELIVAYNGWGLCVGGSSEYAYLGGQS